MLAVVKERPVAGVAVKDIPQPSAAPGEVLVRVRASSICGTDVSIYDWTPWAAGHITPPMVVGHELVGEILEINGEPGALSVGDLVSSETHIFCGHCYQCQIGNRHICENMELFGIGRDGGLPWHISTDLKRFRALTMGKPMIMGRKQYDSIGRPLDGRDNIVLTRKRDFAPPGILVAHDLPDGLALATRCAKARGADEIMVIGGADIFRLCEPLASRIHLTEVHASVPGDVVFARPVFPPWREMSRERHAKGPKDDYDFSYVLLERSP